MIDQKPETEREKLQREKRWKYHFKCFKPKSDKTLYRCIDVIVSEVEDGYGNMMFETKYKFETLYIEDGGGAVHYRHNAMYEHYFLHNYKQISEKEFEDLRDEACRIIHPAFSNELLFA